MALMPLIPDGRKQRTSGFERTSFAGPTPTSRFPLDSKIPTRHETTFAPGRWRQTKRVSIRGRDGRRSVE